MSILLELAKYANILDAVGTEESRQAAEGMSAVLENRAGTNSPDKYVVEDILATADLFDYEGLEVAANLMELFVVNAYPNLELGKKTPREELYDSEKNNSETMLKSVRREIEENRKQHHLETQRGEAPVQTRYSPEMPGVMMLRVSDGVYQDPITRRIYDFRHGWTGDDGKKHPGGSVSSQTPAVTQYTAPSRIFESRIELSKRRG